MLVVAGINQSVELCFPKSKTEAKSASSSKILKSNSFFLLLKDFSCLMC